MNRKALLAALALFLGACSSSGDPGSQGPAGPTGDAGPAGTKGDAGPAGASVVAVQLGAGSLACPGGGSEFTSASGVTHACSGTAGADGATGSQGLRGDRGDPGIDGLQGLPGPKGDAGSPGPAGTVDLAQVIQNQSGVPQGASFSIAGRGAIGGDLSAGSITSAGPVKIGASTAACDAAHAGMLRYSGVGGQVEICQGTAWVGIGPFRRIARSVGYDNDGTDAGPLATRRLAFVKLAEDTGVRISWVDNLRVLSSAGASAACRWEFRIDGAPCSIPGPIFFDYLTAAPSSSNLHQSQSNFGTCFGLSAGPHEVQVWVGSTPGLSGSDCYTGWLSQYHALEVEEVY